MKKTIFYSFIAAAALLGLASCKKDDLGKVDDDAKQPFTITAEIEDNSTKVTYEVDNTNNKIAPKWTAKDDSKEIAGDKIFGFDSNGNTFTFTVTAVDVEGKATLTAEGEYKPTATTTLYAIYYPGKDATYFEGEGTSRTLAVALSSQTGASLGDASPVLMCATATVDGNNNVKFIFSNQTAIVGIKKFKIGANETVTSVKASGLVTSGTFKVEDDKLVLKPGDETSDITVSDLSLSSDATTGIVGTDDTPALMFATLPTTNASISLSATTSETREYVTLTNLTGTILAGGYYYGTKKLDRVAEVTIGGDATIYGTLADAVAAANAATEAATIKMLKDVTLEKKLTIDNANAKKITLELNGCEIVSTTSPIFTFKTESEMKDSDSESNGSIKSTGGRPVQIDGAEFTLTSGKLIGSGENYGTVYICNEANVQFNGGLIKTTTEYSDNPSGIRISNSMVNFKKVDVSAVNYAVYSSASEVSFDPESDDDILIYSSGNYALYSTGDGETVKIAGGCYYTASDKATIFAGSGLTYKCTGGYYNSKENLSPDGGYVVKTLTEAHKDAYNREYSYQIIESVDYAAKVKISDNEIQYQTLAEAVSAANDAEQDATITILSQCSSSKALDLNNSKSKNIILDINGQKVSSSFNIMSNVEVKDGAEKSEGYIESQGKTLCVQESGKLTLTSGDIRATGTASGPANTGIYVNCSSNDQDNLIINGGTVTANSPYGSLCIYKGKATITGGSFTGPRALFTSTGANITISGGKYNAESGTISCIHIGSATLSIEINDGNFYGNDNIPLLSYYNPDKFFNYGKNLTVNGGKFFTHVDIDNLGEGKINNKITETGLKFEIKDGKYDDGETFYDGSIMPFADAVAAANASTRRAEIKLMNDFSISSNVTLNNTNGNGIILDLRGKTITESAATISCEGSGSIILTDSKGNEGQIVSTSTKPTVTVKGKDVVISGGYYSGKYSMGVIRAFGTDANLEISGGKFTNNADPATSEGYAAVNCGNTSSTSAKTTISGGTFESNNEVLRRKWGYLYVTGGYFKSGNNQGIIVDAGNITKISGGYFSEAPKDECIKSGYKVVENTAKSTKDTYPKKVVEDN